MGKVHGLAAVTGDHVTITLITAVCSLATYVFSNSSNASVAAVAEWAAVRGYWDQPEAWLCLPTDTW